MFCSCWFIVFLIIDNLVFIINNFYLLIFVLNLVYLIKLLGKLSDIVDILNNR